MQFIVAAVAGALLQIAASMVGRVLLALGLGFVTYSGFNVGIDWLFTQLKTNMSSMPADVVSFLSWLWVDKAIGLVFSAYTAAVGIKLAGGTTLTKWMHKQ